MHDDEVVPSPNIGVAVFVLGSYTPTATTCVEAATRRQRAHQDSRLGKRWPRPSHQWLNAHLVCWPRKHVVELCTRLAHVWIRRLHVVFVQSKELLILNANHMSESYVYPPLR